MKPTGRRTKWSIRKGDTVVAISGEDAVAGKTGKVLQLLPESGRAIVEGFNYVKKHMRKTQDNPQGGIIEKEAAIHLSNLRKHEGGEHKAARAGRARKEGAGKPDGGGEP